MLARNRMAAGERLPWRVNPLPADMHQRGHFFGCGFAPAEGKKAMPKRDEQTKRIQELQEELAHAQGLADGQVVSALIHEIAQPITAIKNYVSASHRLVASGNQAGVQTALERIEEHTNHASDIINRIRDYVKKRDVQMQPEVLSNVINEAIAQAGSSIGDNDVTLNVEVDQSVQLAEIDRVVVRQVLFNLMRNSLEAMQDQSKRELTISAKEAPVAMVEISVADTGPGLSDEVRRKLFQPFVTTKPGGMGVGLSVCHLVVKRHGGRLWADDNIGGGTVFRFTINRADPAHLEPDAPTE
jgi:two-component system sensor kinase FixL